MRFPTAGQGDAGSGDEIALDAATTGCQKFSDIRSRMCGSFRHNCSCSHVNPGGGGGERVYLNG